MSTMLYDRIFETTNTIGTGAYQLLGAESGFKTFASRFSNGQTLYYCCTDDVDWEIGIGTIDTVAGTIARTTVLASSQGDVAISWASGTRNLFCDLPASLFASLFDSAQAKGPLIRSDVNTYLAPSVLVVSTTQTALLTNWGSTYHFTNTSTVSLNLPAFAAVPDGYFVEVMCGGTASLTVDPNGTETVQGVSTFALTPGTWAKIVKQGTDWKVLSAQGGTLTKALNGTMATVASAATVDLGATNANFVQITGSTNISSFGTAPAGAMRTVEFSSGVTLIHSGNLSLPGAANISTGSGDFAEFVSFGSGVWFCSSYTRSTGAPVAGSATQAQMEAKTATNVMATPGNLRFHPGVVKAWAFWTTSGGILTSALGDGCSVARNGPGDYTITFSNAFSTALYGISGVSSRATGGAGTVMVISETNPPLTTSCRLLTQDGTGNVDRPYNAAIFTGDLP